MDHHSEFEGKYEFPAGITQYSHFIFQQQYNRFLKLFQCKEYELNQSNHFITMATLGLRITQNLRKAAQKPLPRVLREQHVCPEHGHTSWMYAGPEHGFSSWMTRCYSSRQTAEISPLTPDNESRASEAISPPKTDVVQSQVAPPSGGYEYFKTVIKLQMAAPDGAGVTRGDLLSDGQTSAAVDQTTASHVYGNEKTSVRQDTRLMSLNKIYRKTNGTLTAVVSSDRMLSEVTSEADVAELVRKRLRMRRVQRALPETAYNLSAYVEQSDSLQKLLAMGVDLSKVEREPQVAEHLVKVDWHTGNTHTHTHTRTHTHLSKVEREPQVAEHLVKVDWHTGNTHTHTSTHTHALIQRMHTLMHIHAHTHACTHSRTYLTLGARLTDFHIE